jgi:hypothetical protein
MLGINKILGFVRRQVGLRTDTASATGSLHAKVSELKNYVGETLQKPRGYLKTFFSTSSTTYVKALEVNGAGKLDMFIISANSNQTPSIKITIDGNVICDYSVSSILTHTSFCWPGKMFPLLGTPATELKFGESADLPDSYVPMNMEFKNSLTIEISTTNGSAGIRIGYSIED